MNDKTTIDMSWIEHGQGNSSSLFNQGLDVVIYISRNV
jgi:hypothetical protein